MEKWLFLYLIPPFYPQWWESAAKWENCDKDRGLDERGEKDLNYIKSSKTFDVMPHWKVVHLTEATEISRWISKLVELSK